MVDGSISLLVLPVSIARCGDKVFDANLANSFDG
jgi:hypothetical protein